MAGQPSDAAALARHLAAATGAGASASTLAPLLAEVDALFAANQDLVYAACLRFVGNPERAMELAQDTLMTAYQKLPTFRGEARFGTWLLKIARYRCLNALRKHGELLTDDGVIEPAEPAASVLTALRRQERIELVRGAAGAVLDPLEQEVVYLRYTEHLPIEEIDRLVDTGLKSGARGVLQRCREKLRTEIRRRLAQLGQGTSFLRGSTE